jgi:hemolysin activation/secretion protein
MDNNLYFGGTTVANSPADIFQIVLEYNARQTDPSGETSLGSQLFISPGDVTNNNTDEAFSPLRKDAQAAYIYTRIRLEREQDLPFSGYFRGMMLKGALTGQYSNVNLMASEQLGLGGFGSVRGYPERALRGDTGVIFNLELFSPKYHPLTDWFNLGKQDELEFLAFFDYAHGEPYQDSVADPLDDPANLMSVGVGMRYNFNDMLRLRLDYGVRMEDLPVAADNADNGAIHFGLICTF